MLKRELHLSWQNAVKHDACAWLISSSDPAAWIEEIESWKLGHDRIAMHVLPDGSGVLVVPAEKLQSNCRPNAQAYGRVGSIFLPVDAELRPAASDSELTAIAGRATLLFHPSHGLIQASRPVSLADLLHAPRPQVTPWDGPGDVLRTHARIESIGLRIELSLDDVIQHGRDDIATELPEGMPDPEEQRPGASPGGGAWGAMQSGMLRGLRWIIQKMPGGHLPAPLDRVEQWVGSKLENLANNLGLMRNRALSKLLDQLKLNPDEGLKHALPLGSIGAHRGKAPPSASLGRRNTDFRLSNLAGGGAIDGWSVPPDILAELRRQYVELAERERRMGRYRRAAYIYAELLTDLDAAAKVLCQGRFWNDAAIIYRDHLNNPVQAAHCFVEARLTDEAIAIFEKRSMYSELAALHRKLGQEAKAIEALRRWVKLLLDQANRLQAAEVLIVHLDARDEALAVLESGWPHGSDAMACIHRAFDLYGRAGQHGAAHQLLNRLGKEPNERLFQELLELFASLQREYPDRLFRQAAEDLGRLMIAGRLEDASLAEQTELVRSLSALAPNDRLLARDGHRFVDRQRTTAKPVTVLPPPVPKQRGDPGRTIPAALGEIRFKAKEHRWVTALGCGGGVVALAVRDSEVLVALGNADEQQAAHTWKIPGLSKNTSALLTNHSLHPSLILAAIPGDVRLPEWKAPAIFGWDPNLKVGQPSWCPAAPAAAAIGADGTLWIVRLGGADNAMLTSYGPTGAVLENSLLNQPLENAMKAAGPEDPFSLQLACPGDNLVVAIGRHLYRLCNLGLEGSEMPIADFEEPILALVVPPRWAKPHVACVLSTEVQICWLGSDGVRTNRVLGELENPKACFASDGVLVIIAGGDGYLADVDSRGRQRLARFEYSGGTPVSIITGFMARTFGVLDPSGTVTWWKFAMEDLR